MTFAPVGIRCPEHANVGAVRQSPQRTLQNIERATRTMQAPATIVLIALLEPLAGGDFTVPLLFAVLRTVAFLAIAYVVGTLGGGVVTERVGRRLSLPTGALLMALGLVGCATTPAWRPWPPAPTPSRPCPSRCWKCT